MCCPTCANFALKETAAYHQTEFDEVIIKAVNECFYFDYYLTFAPHPEKAKLLLSELVQLLAKRGFHITKWVSNSRSVIALVSLEDRSKELLHLDLSCNPFPKERALGLWWDVESNSLSCRTKADHKVSIRQGILSAINSLYEPLSFSSPEFNV